ncbi:uncharacterized protein LOC135400603 [Ornithodoros turicata]|uniref:uncharacterized protein LOC135400603 n=1 Tax=Ornithodoros turicata TaxID=34597 RepID=UPI0031390B56
MRPDRVCYTPVRISTLLAFQALVKRWDKQRLQIYTDGSVSAGVSTAALFLPSENIEQAFKLPHETSPTEAELVAIHEALKLVSARPPGSWTVLTDSKSALEALSSPRSQVVSDIRSLILVVHNLLVTSGHSVWFQWVPSHIGLPGNTRADTAAKRAHGAAECNTVIPLSPSVCRIHIRRRVSFDTHLFMENTVAANTFLHRIDPKMAFSVSLRLSRKEESALHRLRLNVARTPSFLFKIKQRPSSACPSCSTDADTHHLLMTCPRYAAPRTALTHRLSALGHRDLSLATLLGPNVELRSNTQRHTSKHKHTKKKIASSETAREEISLVEEEEEDYWPLAGGHCS